MATRSAGCGPLPPVLTFLLAAALPGQAVLRTNIFINLFAPPSINPKKLVPKDPVAATQDAARKVSDDFEKAVTARYITLESWLTRAEMAFGPSSKVLCAFPFPHPFLVRQSWLEPAARGEAHDGACQSGTGGRHAHVLHPRNLDHLPHPPAHHQNAHPKEAYQLNQQGEQAAAVSSPTPQASLTPTTRAFLLHHSAWRYSRLCNSTFRLAPLRLPSRRHT